jgi:tetrahydromethanopterin S-methyltransferase subunit B
MAKAGSSGDVKPEHYFRAKDGTVIKSLTGLAEALELMDQQTFDHHIHDGRNDFAAWVNDIIGDAELSRQIRHLKEKKDIIEKIASRVSEIRDFERKLVPSQEPLGNEQTKIENRSTISKKSYSKEYAYGLVIGVIIGVLIGLLL